MANDVKEMFYAMALQGLMPGVSDLIVNSKEVQRFTRKAVKLVALAQEADAEVDEVQARANEQARAIFKAANDRVDAVQKRVRAAHHELVTEIKEFFTEHKLEALLESAKLPDLKPPQPPAPAAVAGVPQVVRPTSVHVLTQPAGSLKTE